jgi:hypothetical protein
MYAHMNERIYVCANICMYACPRMYAFPCMHVHMHACIHARVHAVADVLMCDFAGMTALGNGVVSGNSQRCEKNTDLNRRNLILNAK